VRCHGALVDVRGVGVLLLGPSGIGKSECALELVNRGHRLVADDVVEIERTARGDLVGRAPQAIRHHVEIRGLGIVYVPELFGSEAVRDEAPVDLVCHIDPPGEHRDYERVGIEWPDEELAEVRVPSVTLPARAAGSMATVVEVAAREHALRRSGVNAAARLDARLRRDMGQA
jgi:HPr kinase/phosphorylase